ncbi:MAG TPA: alpha/beta fold hydrolase [Aquihabitans sp.]|nr:alpha/beta fold hydrolase [Aquihabitans sp.]
MLVHGAWHGGWCWDRVRPLLEAQGHRVVTPTLPGLGERRDELTPEVGLADHVDDVVAVLDEAVAGDRPVVLVGHSYAGLVVRSAADRRPDAVERLVLLDAWFGPGEESLFDLAPDWLRDAFVAMADADGDGWRIPPPPPETVGLEDPGDVAWCAPLLTDHPLAAFTERPRLSGAIDRVPTSAIVVQPSLLPFEPWARDAGLPTATLATGHDAMVTAPAELVELLVAAP